MPRPTARRCCAVSTKARPPAPRDRPHARASVRLAGYHRSGTGDGGGESVRPEVQYLWSGNDRRLAREE
jgi:hypothetical protein